MSSLDWAAVSIERETRPPWPAVWKHTLISPKYKHTQKPSVCDKHTHSHLQKYVHACACLHIQTQRQTMEHTLQWIPRHPPRTNTQSNRYMICPCFHPALPVDEHCGITERSHGRKQEEILKINLRVPRNTWIVSSGRWAQKWQSSWCLFGYRTQLKGSKERHSGVIQCVSLLCVLWCNHCTEKVRLS